MPVYFARVVTDTGPIGPVKIGWSGTSATARVRALGGLVPGLTLLAVLDGDRQVERALHKQFVRAPSDGIPRDASPSEWFAPTEELLALIEKAEPPTSPLAHGSPCVNVLRLRLGMSQQALADRAGIDRTLVVRLARGTNLSSYANCDALARGFGIDVLTMIDYVLGRISVDEVIEKIRAGDR